MQAHKLNQFFSRAQVRRGGRLNEAWAGARTALPALCQITRQHRSESSLHPSQIVIACLELSRVCTSLADSFLCRVGRDYFIEHGLFARRRTKDTTQPLNMLACRA